VLTPTFCYDNSATSTLGANGCVSQDAGGDPFERSVLDDLDGDVAR